MKQGELSIWFFIGASLLVNGVIIFGTGIYQYVHPPVDKVVLFEAHAGIWWGGLLALLGGIYCWKYSPAKEAARNR